MKLSGVLQLYRRTSLRVAASAAAVLVILGVLMLPARAQESQTGGFNLTVSPMPIVLETKPGVSVTSEIKVKNESLTDEKVKVSVMKFSAEGEDGSPKLEDVTSADEFASWVSFSETRFTAEPGVWKSINMNIDPPASAAFGYYYAVVFSRDGAESQIEEGRSNLLGAVATLVLLDVQAPGASREAKLIEYTMPKKAYEFLPADFTVRLENKGNVHVAPRGNIFIKQGGNVVGLLEVNAERGFILPNSVRKYTASWQDGSPAYKVVTADGKVEIDEKGVQKNKLDWSNFSPSKFRFGKYTALVTMVYNDGNSDVPVEGEVDFWVIPWRILAVIAVVLLLVFAGLYTTVLRPLRNRLKARKSKE